MNTIQIQVGNEGFGHGLTAVKLEVDGRITISNRRRVEVSKKLTDKAEAAMARTIFKLAAEIDLSALAKTRKAGIPDEASYQFVLDNKEFEFWEGDIEENPPLKKLLDLLKEFVSDSSNGEVIL